MASVSSDPLSCSINFLQLQEAGKHKLQAWNKTEHGEAEMEERKVTAFSSRLGRWNIGIERPLPTSTKRSLRNI